MAVIYCQETGGFAAPRFTRFSMLCEIKKSPSIASRLDRMCLTSDYNMSLMNDEEKVAYKEEIKVYNTEAITAARVAKAAESTGWTSPRRRTLQTSRSLVTTGTANWPSRMQFVPAVLLTSTFDY